MKADLTFTFLAILERLPCSACGLESHTGYAHLMGFRGDEWLVADMIDIRRREARLGIA